MARWRVRDRAIRLAFFVFSVGCLVWKGGCVGECYFCGRETI
jgi:hypothetical protein